jgi:hypothetical protein
MTFSSPPRIDTMIAILTPVDEAFRTVDKTWGVGRLERLVSTKTLESYHRGWTQWRQAIDTHDTATAKVLAPKMLAALKFMEAEAQRSGHPPLDVNTWETQLPDGRVLCIVRTCAEAHRIAQALANIKVPPGDPDENLPPDLLLLVKHQQEGREIIVWTLAELAMVLPKLDVLNAIKVAWPGATVTRGPITSENQAHDWATSDPAAPDNIFPSQTLRAYAEQVRDKKLAKAR